MKARDTMHSNTRRNGMPYSYLDIYAEMVQKNAWRRVEQPKRVEYPNRKIVAQLYHMDDMEFLGEDGMQLSAGRAMVAGAVAGVTEHIAMYPVDTIKTRMQAHGSQAQPLYHNVFDAISKIVKAEGVGRLYRGFTAVVIGAIPSHAAYFATYEACRHTLGGNKEGLHPIANGISGGIATMAHDAVVTPLDVIKQRLQLYKSTDLGVIQTFRKILRVDGVKMFYASYPITVLMNVPFMTVHFATYESLKVVLTKANEQSGTAQHLIAGAGAGALGGFISNPLDVVKTRLQLQGVSTAPRYDGLRDCFRQILREEGPSAFWRGTTARVLYFMPSAAICWSTYEAMKRLLSH